MASGIARVGRQSVDSSSRRRCELVIPRRVAAKPRLRSTGGFRSGFGTEGAAGPKGSQSLAGLLVTRRGRTLPLIAMVQVPTGRFDIVATAESPGRPARGNGEPN